MNQLRSSSSHVLIHENCFDLHSMGEYTVILHGGAGPQDPRGIKAQRAANSLVNTLDFLFDPSTDMRLFGKDEWPSAASLRQELYDQNWAAFFYGSRLAALPRIGKYALAGVASLEKDPLFNAGWGAALQRDGVARVSASYMDSVRRKFSSVINVPECLHPSLLAAFLQDEKHCMRDAQGAQNLMASLGLKPQALLTPERFEQWVEKKRQSLQETLPDEWGTGTVGAIVVNAAGALAAVTSTGGVGFEPVGRIGDSGTTSGNYVSENFACSCTGYGEQITDLGFAVRVAARIQTGESLSQAFGAVMAEASRREFGLAAICAQVDRGKLHVACGTTEEYFVWAYRNSAGMKIFQDFIPA